MAEWLAPLLEALASPVWGLPALFVIALLAATVAPLGSEPALLAVLALNPALLWPAVGVATLGNVAGSAITYGMGRGAHRLVAHTREAASTEGRALRWLRRFGPPACVLAFLPGIGDVLCAVAGWLRLPWLSCMAWAALGKLGRYVFVALAFVAVRGG